MSGTQESEVENKKSTLTAQSISKNESQTNVDFTKDHSESETNLSESLPDNLDHNQELENDEDKYINLFLRSFPWYHGIMFSDLVEKLVKWENSFVVRRLVQKSKNRMLCISIKSEGKLFNYRIRMSNKEWHCDELFAKFSDTPPRGYTHVHELLDAWSLLVNFSVPVPRSKMVIFHETIILGRKLGKGAFGEVFKALFLPAEGKEMIDVAVKQVIGSATRSQIQEFCHEACVMAPLRHRNVVTLHGIASLRMPVMLVMEVVPGGDLRKHVQRSSFISNQQMVLFALDIARGMAHLASKGVLHRDLAARNCLITKSLVVKISDFGLSVVSNETVVKNLKKAPIRWLSPETLQKGVFNERTDVWSYGVLCTELLTRCANDPLWPRDLKECQKWIKESEHPHRVPAGLQPKELIEISEMCCDKDPDRRPNFKTLRSRVSHMYDKIHGSLGVTRSVDGITKTMLSGRRSHVILSRKKSRDTNLNNSKERRSIGPRLMSFRKKTGKSKSPSARTKET